MFVIRLGDWVHLKRDLNYRVFVILLLKKVGKNQNVTLAGVHAGKQTFQVLKCAKTVTIKGRLSMSVTETSMTMLVRQNVDRVFVLALAGIYGEEI